jgi:hypothetical protein
MGTVSLNKTKRKIMIDDLGAHMSCLSYFTGFFFNSVFQDNVGEITHMRKYVQCLSNIFYCFSIFTSVTMQISNFPIGVNTQNYWVSGLCPLSASPLILTDDEGAG